MLTLHADLTDLQPAPFNASRRSPSQCRMMILDIVKLYITLISEFFKLSDIAVMAAPDLGRQLQTQNLLPSNSNALTTAHYLIKIMGEVQETVNDISAMDISEDASSGLKSLVESARWRFTETLAIAWRRGNTV